jgi:hypothetical protein
MTLLRRSLILVLPLLLLIAQHGALAHAISHLDPDAAPAQEKSLVHGKLCGKCLSAEKLTHLSAAPAATATVESAHYVCTPQVERASFARSLSPYLSRGPPVIL